MRLNTWLSKIPWGVGLFETTLNQIFRCFQRGRVAYSSESHIPTPQCRVSRHQSVASPTAIGGRSTTRYLPELPTKSDVAQGRFNVRLSELEAPGKMSPYTQSRVAVYLLRRVEPRLGSSLLEGREVDKQCISNSDVLYTPIDSCIAGIFMAKCRLR